MLPKTSEDKSSETLIIETKNSELNKIFKKFKIDKFEKAFPTAVTPSLKNVYFIKCNDKKLGKK